jgi:putative transcriptional regulator
MTKSKVASRKATRGSGEAADADNPSLGAADLKGMRRLAPIKRVRWQLGLSQEEFAERFQIPLGTLRDWEQGRSEPDKPARAYLKVIGSDPAFVSRALKGGGTRRSTTRSKPD